MFRIRNHLFILALCLFVSYIASGQNSYPIVFGGPHYDDAWSFYEDTVNQRYLLFGGQLSKVTEADNQGVVYSIGYNLDTCRYYFHSPSPDTCWYFNYGFKRPQGGYLIIGVANEVFNYGHNAWLLFVITDDSLNLISYKIYHPPWYDKIALLTVLTHTSGSFVYLSGKAKDDLSSNQVIYLMKIDYEGNAINSETIPNDISPFFVQQIMAGADASTLWVIGNGYEGQANECCVAIDTNFTVKWSRLLPEPSIFVASMSQAKLRWVSDTSLVMMSIYTYLGTTIQDDDMGFSEIDTTFAFSPVTYFGAKDTVDYPAHNRSFDFRDTDTIYFAGTLDYDFEFWAYRRNWIMAGQLDHQFNARFIRYFGGDAFYRPLTMGITNDGGMIVAAWRYDRTALNDKGDLIIWKLDANGLLTSIDPHHGETVQGRLAVVYPNPGTDRLVIECGAPSAVLQLTAMSGVAVLNKVLKGGTNIINTGDLPAGTYLYRLAFPNGETESGKWIKN